MNTQSIIRLFSVCLLTCSSVAIADDDESIIDEVISFASKSDVESVSFEADAFDVTDSLESVKVASVSALSLAKPVMKAPKPVATDSEEKAESDTGTD